MNKNVEDVFRVTNLTTVAVVLWVWSILAAYHWIRFACVYVVDCKGLPDQLCWNRG